MNLDTARVRQLLNSFELTKLFIEELGWDRLAVRPSIAVDGVSYSVQPVAEKHGVQIFECVTDTLPSYALRQKIERQVRKLAHEHLIIFTDTAKTTQVWQWVARQQGKPAAYREYQFYKNHSADALITRLNGLVFTLNDEEGLTITGVTTALKESLNREKVTKRFYDYFKEEHDTFQEFLDGIPIEDDQRWYASVMLNRLMFIYFIQSKGFLNDDHEYLKNKLAESERRGKDRFYRDFLCPLFFEGFAEPESKRSTKAKALLGKIPYLNGGIFQEHQLEKAHGKDIKMPDKAFNRLFEFFDRYRWHLDERLLSNQNEINPDILGYIFEKYINQKQMGAYYTKEDITEYISKNTIIPYLFDAARPKCRIAFDGEHSIWKLLQSDPDRYIYPAILKGVTLPLPQEIVAGIGDVSKRTGWNRPATEEFALPTEIWREVVARRQRYEEVSAKILAGEIREINDLITYNLNIRQFAQDVIQESEGPELIRAFWKAIEEVTVLDPTCGSGAFLFAALNILEPLYEACLDRMQVFVDELDRSGEKHHSEKFSDFRKILARIEQHPNRRYFILKSIIVKNLYGVDIMEEAVEICKLRLFLKLVAQTETADKIEPLPDIDFNIRAGNTLVGYATLKEAKVAVTSKLDFDNAWAKIEQKASDLQQISEQFRERQLSGDGTVPSEDKEEIQKRLNALNDELNHYLAKEYGVKPERPKALKEWQESHRPLHWFIEFFGIMQDGGFCVIVGNPPYVEYREVANDYGLLDFQTQDTGNLYAYVTERSYDILQISARLGLIVQLPIVCTDRMEPLQRLCLGTSEPLWFATFDDRPAMLFDGLEHIRATIFTAKKVANGGSAVFCTNYNRWYTDARQHLFDQLQYADTTGLISPGVIPKIGDKLGIAVYNALRAFPPLSNSFSNRRGYAIYFHNAPQYWIRAMDFTPYFWNERRGQHVSTQVKELLFSDPKNASVATAYLNSTLFYWWFVCRSDCRHLNLREISNFPVSLGTMSTAEKHDLSKTAASLMNSLRTEATRKTANYKTTGKVVYDEFFPKLSKPLIDEIDQAIVTTLGLSPEIGDYIVNYDIKYRMGQDDTSEE